LIAGGNQRCGLGGAGRNREKTNRWDQPSADMKKPPTAKFTSLIRMLGLIGHSIELFPGNAAQWRCRLLRHSRGGKLGERNNGL